jgi:aminoglycoside N3'-acetyltransferase
VTPEAIRDQLLDLGVAPGGVLVVHCAFSAVRPVDGGPEGLIAALRAALGPQGTLVMPTMSDDDGVVFDRVASPCLSMGVVPETFRRLPGVLRSDSPHGFAAIGPAAAAITAPHPVDIPHGLDSPPGRVLECNGQVLLVGVGHDANTTIHVAEELAHVRYRRPKWVMVLRDGSAVRHDYEEIDHCCQRFALVDEWLDAERLQRRGSIGNAEARLMRARDVVRIVTARLRADETAFLHPPGVDVECDEARASLERRP